MASFQVMDITTPFPFSDASFDLVNARLLVAVVYKHLYHRIDFSYHTPAYEAVASNLKIALVILHPFLVKMGYGTQKELEVLYEQVMLDLASGQFRGHMDLTTVWGRKR